MIYLAQFFLELIVLRTKFVEKIKIHNLSSVTFFSEDRVVYEIMWKNIVEPDGLQLTIMRRVRTACWIPKATNTH